MRKILIVIALILSVAACQQRTGTATDNGTGSDTTGMTDSMWRDSATKLYTKIHPYYLNNQKDSFFDRLPAVQQFCREHNTWHTYFISWTKKVDLLIWEDDYKTATKEAKAMYDEAEAQKDSFGLASACASMGTIYVHQDNYREATKNFAKALDYYPEKTDPGCLIICYFYYCQATELMQDHATTDSILQKWAKLIYKYPLTEHRNTRANWRVQYLFNHFNYLKNMDRLAEAEPLIDSLYYYEEMEGNVPRNYALINRAHVDLLIAKEDYAKALIQNKRYRKLEEELENNTGIVTYFLQQAIITKGLGRWREAYEAVDSARMLNDSITQADNREELNELNKRFEVNELKMQQERERLQAQEDIMKARQHQWMLIVTIGALVLIAIIVVVVMRLRSARRYAAVSAQNERIESELRIARHIQMSMVPNTFPQHEGLDMYASMIPAREVGGDLYDYILSGQNLYFCLGDVSGKGVPASIFMGQTLRLFRSMAKQGMMPADICTRMNDELTDGNDSAMFVTFFIGLLDLTTGHLDFCNAGHNPPVIGGDSQQGNFLEMEPNAPIGLWADLQYVGEEIDTIKGRPLFLYTDGLNEAENTDKEQFGDDRLISILRNTHFDTARQVIENLEAAVDAHRNGAEPNDDLTMFCIRVR